MMPGIRIFGPHSMSNNSLTDLDIAQAIGEKAPAALYAYEINPFRVLFSNEQTHLLLGYGTKVAAEWTTEDLLALIHPDDVANIKELLQETSSLKEGQTREAELRMQRVDGSMRWFSVLESPLQVSETGETLAVLGTIEDITANVVADRELAFHREFEQLMTHASRRFISSTFTKTDEIVTDVLRDISRAIPLAECHLCRVHDRMPEKLSLTHHFTSDGENSVLQGLSWVPVNVISWLYGRLQQGTPLLIRDTNRLPAESQLFRSILLRSGIESYLVIPLLVGDTAWGFLGLIPHRTNRIWQKDIISLLHITGEILLNGIQRAERDKELQLSEERWRSVARTASDLLVIMQEDGTITYSSYTLSDQDERQHAGQSIYSLVAPAFREQLRDKIQKVLHENRYLNLEYQGLGQGGREEWCRARIGPHMQDGDIVGVTFLSISIQDTKDREEQIEKLQSDFEHAARLGVLGSMSTEIAHQLNQPLQVIESYISGCRSLLSRDQMTPDKLSEVMDQISEAVLDAGDTIHGICDFVRNRGPVSESCSINEIVENALRLAQATIRKCGVKVEKDLAEDLPLVSGNSIQITHALLNLMINGIEAMVSARFDTPKLEICSRLNGDNEVEVSVIDHGPGIPDDVQRDIFDQFFTTKSTGLGIGLALSRNIIEAHKGRLWLKSSSSRGADFRLALPIIPSGVVGLDGPIK